MYKTLAYSVFQKEGLKLIVEQLNALNFTIYSTGGTEKFIADLGITVKPVEDLTNYPSILGGRVKTLHPKVFGGILGRRENKADLAQLADYEIPEIDVVIVDLYPFEKTVASGAEEQEIIEKIDIGGISLIRAAAKNFNDVLCISAREQYDDFLKILINQKGEFTLEQRKIHAAKAFAISSHYDTAIYNYLNKTEASFDVINPLRYGENPHQ